MKHLITLCLFITLSAIPGFAQDMRASHQEAFSKKRALIHQAEEEARHARQEAEDLRNKIGRDKQALTQAVRKLNAENRALEKTEKDLEKTLAELKEREDALREALVETEAVNRELSGFIRSNAKDLDALVSQSPQTAFDPDRGNGLKPLIQDTGFPSMDGLTLMTDLMFDEIDLSGAVRLVRGPIVDREGHDTDAAILLLGNFTAIYHTDHETGFLLYSDQSRRLFALSKLPKGRIVKQNKAYMSGKSDGVYLDISKGGALRQLTHELSLLSQIPKGGPIVWPILALLVAAVVIIIERVIALVRKNAHGERFTRQALDHVHQGRWEELDALCDQHDRTSIARVLKAGAENRTMDRTDMENVLQETILSEIPKLERFLSTLGMLAAIAPLLGLLGTVTGMINTFHVITYYGTGDPRMMSGGISEALVTTMLGLAVAIPIMLAHTLLSRQVDKMIGEMEEKGVSFVNMVYKSC